MGSIVDWKKIRRMEYLAGTGTDFSHYLTSVIDRVLTTSPTVSR